MSAPDTNLQQILSIWSKAIPFSLFLPTAYLSITSSPPVIWFFECVFHRIGSWNADIMSGVQYMYMLHCICIHAYRNKLQFQYMKYAFHYFFLIILSQDCFSNKWILHFLKFGESLLPVWQSIIQTLLCFL